MMVRNPLLSIYPSFLLVILRSFSSGFSSSSVNHPGLNNGYQVTAQTKLARLYNDRSVLENHHCAKAFEIFDQSETSILQNLSAVDYREFRYGLSLFLLSSNHSPHCSLIYNGSR